MNKPAPARIACMVLAAALVVALAPPASFAAQPPGAEQAAHMLATARPLAEQGNANAQYNLGVLYDKGYGVDQDYARARQWYEKAAAQHYARAEHNLGILYQEGRGVAVDHAKAAEWFKRAAEQGVAAAQNNLAVMYARGQGVPHDAAKAARWAARAARADNAAARANLPEIVAALAHAKVDGDEVNVRDKPSTDAKVLRQVSRATPVTVLATRDQWKQVLLPDDYAIGWVAGYLLTGENGDKTQPSSGTAEAGARPAPADTPAPAASASRPARRIAKDGVNVRAKASREAEVKFQARKDAEVTVVDDENNWSRVRFTDGREGWIANFLLVAP